ncbi:hypothetical protein AVEN_135447-1 [Araneus ventricosus]|uniref:Uncharacterized protein n=1 Tax=Araneus ventricosus TaxID=182803 RepID=A0A4Y2BEA9_ARAVE|nr:hypothetical protein AVEN_135447-1 [Araneus ventricosus]
MVYESPIINFYGERSTSTLSISSSPASLVDSGLSTQQFLLTQLRHARNVRRSQQDHMTTEVKKKYPKQTLTLDLWSPEEMRQEKKAISR